MEKAAAGRIVVESKKEIGSGGSGSGGSSGSGDVGGGKDVGGIFAGRSTSVRACV